MVSTAFRVDACSELKRPSYKFARSASRVALAFRAARAIRTNVSLSRLCVSRRGESSVDDNCFCEKEKARDYDNGADQAGEAFSGGSEALQCDGGGDDGHCTQIHHADDEKDCGQARAAVDAVEA